jgi:multicomponent Na+:H+ antiporter subunit D
MSAPADPALLVAVPLAASVLPVVVGRVSDGLGRALTVAALAGHAALVALLAASAALDGPIRTVVGGIPTPYGIALVVDGLSAPFLALTALVGLGVRLATYRSGSLSGPADGLYLLLVAGVTGVCLTGDLFNLYVFLEISGLSAYALVARADGGPAALAALKYLFVGTVGASLYLLGVGYAYVATGTLDMRALALGFEVVGGVGATLPLAAFCLLLAGLAVKMALFPVHVWKPDAYAAAPPAVAAPLAALVSTAAGYATLRLVLTAFPGVFAAVPVVRTALVAVGVASVAGGSALAFRAADVRRLLAYSSVAQFGLVAIAVALATPVGLVGVAVHLVGHAVAKGALFLAAGTLAVRYGVRTIDDYAGLGGRAPVTAVAVAVLVLSLVGIPPTVGFASKLYILLGTIEANAPVVAAVVLASTLTSLAYFAPLLQRLFVSPVSGATRSLAADGGRTLPRPTLAALVVAAGLTVALGFGAAALAGVVEPVVEGVVG